MKIDTIHNGMVRVIGQVETRRDVLTLLVELHLGTALRSIRVQIGEDGKGGKVIMMISPTLSRGSSFINTILKQLNSLFANRLTGHLDLLAHRTGVPNSAPLHLSVE
jgi:hypothetical protein